MLCVCVCVWCVCVGGVFFRHVEKHMTRDIYPAAVVSFPRLDPAAVSLCLLSDMWRDMVRCG